MERTFPPKKEFRSLSIADLLKARDVYHPYLSNMENVVGTAIGLYRLRKEDPDAKEAKDYNRVKDVIIETPRTLQNTIVQPWSWPCLLVFVNKWMPKKDLYKQHPDQVVPKFLYLPDGKMIPVCVIFAEEQKDAPPPLQDLSFPHELIGGGYPVVTEEQEKQYVGSIGCLVTDGNSVFALTNRHVAGEEGRKIFSFFDGDPQKIGISHGKQLGKKLFKDAYPDWAGSHVYCNLDAGLIYIDDLNYWTAQVFGIGELDKPVDLNPDTITLDLIGCPLRAFGAASGELIGEIKALFYRYKSIGGFEYTSDLLIGPRDEKTPLATRPGDSGTLWFFDEGLSPNDSREKGLSGKRARRLRPLALQWGGHVFKADVPGGKFSFALATCLSTILRELDLDVVSSWNTGHSEYWGKTGHYKIAAKACELVKDQKLKKLLVANVETIGFDDQAIEAGELKRIDRKQFVALADVPDLVWRTSKRKDAVNHFADMDEEGRNEFEGKTLLELCKDEKNIDISVWNRFYDSLKIRNNKRGALPFRVWQIYNYMVKFVKAGEIDKFICAGGVLSHYVADACNPLHISRLHHGDPENPKEKPVHSKYENDLLDRYAVNIIAGVNDALKNPKGKIKQFVGGYRAAIEVVKLMGDTLKKLSPEKIIESFNEKKGTERLPHMFDTLGKPTIACMVDGCILLASFWNNAWQEGKGYRISANRLGLVSRSVLKDIYNDRDFLPAHYLSDEELASELK
jgi:hypothetical protein